MLTPTTTMPSALILVTRMSWRQGSSSAKPTQGAGANVAVVICAVMSGDLVGPVRVVRMVRWPRIGAPADQSRHDSPNFSLGKIDGLDDGCKRKQA